MSAAEEAIALQLIRVEKAAEYTFKERFEPGLPLGLIRTRALAAFAVQIIAAEDAATAAASVIDGAGDFGLDAVYVDESAGRLLLVQSKWRENPQRSMTVGDTLKYLQGVRAVMNEQYERFGEKLDALAPRISSVINRHGARVELVVVTNSVCALSADVRRALDDECRVYSSPDEQPMTLRVLGLEDVHTHVLNAEQGASIELTATVNGWGRIDGPRRSYYGRIPAAQLADWYQLHGDRLFDRNIRRALGLTSVNQGLVETLLTEPENFWYFNNGITILCGRVGHAPAGSAQRERAELTMFDVNVVNGAQTVASIAAAAQRAPDCLDAAQVLVRVISLEAESESFAEALTRANNTQNSVSVRDFTALDARQQELRRDFALTLRKTYAIKRGEPTPLPEDGCTVDEAALALACAHPDARFAVYAHANPGTLLNSGSARYREIFHDDRPAHVVWRLVRAARRVGQVVAAAGAATEGRDHLVTRQGRALATHLALRSVRGEEIEDLGKDWDGELDRIGLLATTVIDLMIDRAATDFAGDSVATLFKNVGSCLRLLDLIAADLRSGRQAARRAAPKAGGDGDGLIFLLFRRGIAARGRLVGNGFVVEAGSTAVAHPTPSFVHNRSAHSRREWLIRQGALRPHVEGDALLVLVEDQYFDSPSQAYAVLTGSTANGRTAWSTPDGTTLNRALAAARTRAETDQGPLAEPLVRQHANKPASYRS